MNADNFIIVISIGLALQAVFNAFVSWKNKRTNARATLELAEHHSAVLRDTRRLEQMQAQWDESFFSNIAVQADSARFRWLVEDDDSAEWREHRRRLCERLTTMSYAAACQAIDAAITEHATDKVMREGSPA